MLQDYLADEEQGISSGRNPIASINEALRGGRTLGREKTKVGSSPVSVLYRIGRLIGDLDERSCSRFSDLEIPTLR